MASVCNRFITRASNLSLRSSIKSSIHRSTSSSTYRFPSSCSTSPIRRSPLYRNASQLGSVQSLLPLHSAVSVARMMSCLSSSLNCRSLSQGTLCRTYPGL